MYRIVRVFIFLEQVKRFSQIYHPIQALQLLLKTTIVAQNEESIANTTHLLEFSTSKLHKCKNAYRRELHPCSGMQ